MSETRTWMNGTCQFSAKSCEECKWLVEIHHSSPEVFSNWQLATSCIGLSGSKSDTHRNCPNEIETGSCHDRKQLSFSEVRERARSVELKSGWRTRFNQYEKPSCLSHFWNQPRSGRDNEDMGSHPGREIFFWLWGLKDQLNGVLEKNN